jgi:RNA polymerase sigma-70 factor (ECF subfamily)
MNDDRRLEEAIPLPAGGGFAALLLRCEGELRRVIAGMGFGPADADDILQDVRIKALGAAQAWHGEEDGRRWLLRVTTNRCIVEFRQRRRFQRQAAEMIARRQVESRPARCPDVEAMQAEEMERVRAGLADLDESLLAPLVLKYFNGLTSQEIGAVLALPPGTVRGRLHEGRLMLARRLMEGGRR